MIKLSTLKLNPDNPRQIKPERFEALKKSIKDFKKMLSIRPLVIDENNVVLGGNMRLRALQELGYTEIKNEWVKKEKDLTEEEKRQFIIKDNVEFGEYDMDILANNFEMDELTDWGIDETELKIDAWNKADEDKLDEVPEVQKEAVSKLGDLFLIDKKHRLLCGDSTIKEDVERLMDGKKANLCFTDPPYNIGYDYWDYIDKKEPDEYKVFCIKFFNVIKSLSERQIITTGHQNIGLWCSIEKPTHIGVWLKTNATSGCKISMFNVQEPLFFYGEFTKFRKRKNDLFEFNNSRQKYVDGHSCPKQVKLLEDLFIHYSRGGKIVVDIFLGSGSTLIACQQTNRICFGAEIDPIYIDVILRRYKNLYPEAEIECLSRKNYPFKKLFSKNAQNKPKTT